MYEIVVYNGNFYRFHEPSGNVHTVAGEAAFSKISREMPFALITPLPNRWGFCMASGGQIHGDNWQVFTSPDECHKRANEYHDKIVAPLNEDWEKREKRGDFDEPSENSLLYTPD